MYKKRIGAFLLVFCLLIMGSMQVLAAETTVANKTELQQEQEGNIYDGNGNLINIDAKAELAALIYRAIM